MAAERKRVRRSEEKEEEEEVVGPMPGDFTEDVPATKKAKCKTISQIVLNSYIPFPAAIFYINSSLAI